MFRIFSITVVEVAMEGVTTMKATGDITVITAAATKAMSRLLDTITVKRYSEAESSHVL